MPSPLLAPPAPAPPIAWPGHVQAAREAAAVLAATAAELRATLDALAGLDQPEAWRGAVARRVRGELDEHRRRLTHPVVGVATRLDEAAARLAVRADALEAACTTAPPLPC